MQGKSHRNQPQKAAAGPGMWEPARHLGIHGAHLCSRVHSIVGYNNENNNLNRETKVECAKNKTIARSKSRDLDGVGEGQGRVREGLSKRATWNRALQAVGDQLRHSLDRTTSLSWECACAVQGTARRSLSSEEKVDSRLQGAVNQWLLLRVTGWN